MSTSLTIYCNIVLSLKNLNRPSFILSQTFRLFSQLIFARIMSANQSNCVFCNIIHENDKGKIIYEDEQVVVFPDIKPAAPHHYLVVPKDHVLNAKQLNPEHKPLVEKMVQTANRILEEKGCSMTDVGLGFHWPPFNSIAHLHLHAIAPKSEMGFAGRLIFRQDSWWFVSPQYVLSRL